ncbi:hypothetical protein E1B28_011688 [Marasmius oreades]|uniref:Uncharacterized protein n=1 Tax=Marasmius oreades TaxID=181124 RepID=A0A9P7RUK6_9AGAR|nr:uncharacterized protein E1B28_011688 [Marasmius oreades]KAG7090071.1 hypothetical protein E1B28_011688 [Marasmius oreades]
MASPSTTETSPLLIPQTLGKHPRDGDYPDHPGQALKRVKAANSRQRRKRERDEIADGGMGCDIANEHDMFPQSEQQWFQEADGQISADFILPLSELQQPQRPRNSRGHVDPDNLSPGGAVRRERVRAAARERQRKHRALVKERKMKALGFDGVGSEVVQNPAAQAGVSDYHQQQTPQSQQYQQLLQGSGPPQPHNDSAILYPPPVPQIVESSAPGTTGGEVFATTLLLSFSCAPLLKQHLLDSLQMTNEELASLEPLIADAWEQWNAKRQERFDPNQPQSNGSGSSSSTPNAHPAAITNDFRTRFQRSVATPIPFQMTTGASPCSDTLDRSVSEASTSD